MHNDLVSLALRFSVFSRCRLANAKSVASLLSKYQWDVFEKEAKKEKINQGWQ